ncbi:MAG: hypothetical protein QW101_06560 [Ignisphaera sp.]|uniref:Uncharacterized protein n=1 Tax=Ignisphaera aggregans TaxID=334771 RepID=A0A832EWG3_9CREN
MELILQESTCRSTRDLSNGIKERTRDSEAIDVVALCINSSLYEIRIRFFGLIYIDEILNVHRSIVEFAKKNGYRIHSSRIESPSMLELVYSLKGDSP